MNYCKIFTMKIFIIIILCFFISLTFLVSSDEKVIYYFDPDNNMPSSEIIRFSTEYFNSINSTFFIQPILRLEDLSDLISKNEVKYLIMSPFFINILSLESNIQPLLTSYDENNMSSYRKLLLTRKGEIDGIEALQGRMIASISYGSEGDRIINSLLFGNNLPQIPLNMIWVRRDFDAIMGLSFFQVDGALVSNRSYNLFKNSRESAGDELTIISQTEEIKLPYLYSFTLNNGVSDDIKKKFTNMHTCRIGKKLLNVIGIEKWK